MQRISNNHLGIKSCLEFQEVVEWSRKNVKIFEGQSELDENFNKSIKLSDELFYDWHRKNSRDIPKCHGCCDFVNNSSIAIVLKRKLDFTNFPNKIEDKSIEKIDKNRTLGKNKYSDLVVLIFTLPKRQE